jgi:hypothetical protein
MQAKPYPARRRPSRFTEALHGLVEVVGMTIGGVLLGLGAWSVIEIVAGVIG